MAVEYISYVKITSTSQSVSVPADCTVAVFSCGEYDATTGSTLNSVSLTTAISDGDANGTYQRITYIVNPATGSRTFAYNPPDGLGYGNWLIFLKGVNTSDPIVSTGSEEPATSPISLTASAGDMMIGRIYAAYYTTLSAATSGQTQIDIETDRAATAYKVGATEFAWTVSDGNPIVGVAAVFRAAATGTAKPKLMNSMLRRRRLG